MPVIEGLLDGCIAEDPKKAHVAVAILASTQDCTAQTTKRLQMLRLLGTLASIGHDPTPPWRSRRTCDVRFPCTFSLAIGWLRLPVAFV